MPCSDDERREAARLLRAVKPIWYDISDSMCMLVTSIGFSCTANGDCHGSSERRECVMRVFQRLADLIDPPTQCPYYHSDRHHCSAYDDVVDRDALLALADAMEEKADDWDVSQDDVPLVHAGYLTAYAERIRKALGVTDGD